MNFDTAREKIAAAILYEGYILYPVPADGNQEPAALEFWARSIPRVYAQAQRPEEPFRLVAECLVAADADG